MSEGVSLWRQKVIRTRGVSDILAKELLPTSQAFWKTRRPDEAADYRAVRRFVCAEKISQTLQNVEM